MTIVSIDVYGQMTTSIGQTAQQLVQNVLVGGGVTVTNIQFSGDPCAIGTFNNGLSSNLGLNSGIVMTTGEVSGIDGPTGPNNTGSSGVDNGRPGYQLLQNTAQTTNTFNAAVLEFDFIPTSDTVQFRFVFGSEEYNEYVCSQFNDVFAFYLSGPNPNGGNYNNQNIALIPGTQIPIAINNVNNGSAGSSSDQACPPGIAANVGYYVDNEFNTSPLSIQYDGYTVPITATGHVICGETYHMIFAIADVIDGVYDSGIFLEANSFESPTSVTLNADVDFIGANGNLEMAEGCSEATLYFERNSADLSSSITIPLLIGGTAQLGIDYSALPQSVTFNPGESLVTLTLEALEDNIVEGAEFLTVGIEFPDPCGNSSIQQVEIAINDVEEVEFFVDDYTVECPDDSIFASAQVTGGYPDYYISWNGEGFNLFDPNQTYNASPNVTTDYLVQIYDACIGDTITDTFNVFVPQFGPILISPIDNETTNCPYTSFTFFGQATGGSGNYNFSWNGSSVSQLSFTDNPVETTSYYLEVTDNCGNFASESFSIIVNGTVLSSEITTDTMICPGDTMELFVQAFGGQGFFTYNWQELNTSEQLIYVNPQFTTTYVVEIMDSCQTYVVYDTVTVEVIRPVADFDVLSNENTEGLLINFLNTSEYGNYWWWDLGNGDSSNVMHPQTTYDTAGWYTVHLYIENEIGCWDSISKPIYIKPEAYFYAPNAFTPNGDGMNDFFSIPNINSVKFECLIFNRWGELIYETKDTDFQWDGSYQGEKVPNGVYVYRLYIENIRGEHHLFNGHVVVLE